jgi:hypothetical protein
MKITGRDGILRIYDSTPILHGTLIYGVQNVDMVKFNGVATWTNVTNELMLDDTTYAYDLILDNSGQVYVGSTLKFGKVQFLKGGGAQYAAGSGALIAKYYNGSTWATLAVTDGTFTSPDCFAKDGYISFVPPVDWAIGANAYNANLDADKYYIQLMTTTSSTVDVDVDVLCPCDDEYFEVVFANMDFSGPLGRPLTEEILVLNRAKMDSNAHFIEGPDNRLYDPLPISFSALLDDTVNRLALRLALTCDNPSSTYWTATGTSTKGDSKNDGTNANPTFADTVKKTVNIQMLWDTGRSGGHDEGVAYYEVYFDDGGITFKEDDNGVTVTCNGICYGVIESIFGFGNRF